MPPILALLTDFGTRDHYVGAMKGAILGVAPAAQIVDITHEIPPGDVEGAAFALAAAHAAFPPGTAFAVVVDPGVGTGRRGLAVAAGPYLFVGPDNGVFSLVLDRHPDARVHALENAALWRPQVAATFHGRDVFGPVAAHLAGGVPLEACGPRLADPVRLPFPPVRTVGSTQWEGAIVHVDRFGNLISCITAEALAGMIGADGDVVVGAGGAVAPLVRTYGDVAPGEPCALIGSSGLLEFALRDGSASEVLGAARGDVLRVRRVDQPI
jgi:S-adenosyl-L-methionine hydrolase (adenosine-forming)